MSMQTMLLTRLNVFSICLNVILLTILLYQTFHPSKDVFRVLSKITHRSNGLESVVAEKQFQTTQESLYTMYGEGNFSDSDEHLLNYIRSMTSQQGPGGYRLANPSRYDFSQVGGAQFVDQLLNQRRDGFFVECGAFTGEDLSDTLFFERKRNWTGILIEASPSYHYQILKKNRRALVLRGCLSHSPRPGLAKFRLQGWGSGVSSLNKNVKAGDKTIPETDVQCFSLNSIMAAIGVRHIDFFVLDVEGSELPVLQTIDWKSLSIDVFNIEYSEANRLKKLDKIRQYFNETSRKTGRRYKEVGTLPLANTKDTAQDVIFMRV